MTSKKIDYAVYRGLEKILGEHRAGPFHPLNRHPLTFTGGGEPVGHTHEIIGGPEDGATCLHLDWSKGKNAGGSRLASWLRLLWPPNYREAREWTS